MRQLIGAGLVGLVLAAAAPALAEEAQRPGEQGKGDKSLGAQVDEALERALRSLERFIDRVPGYEAPEIMPNGDIVIRKKPPRPAPEDASPAGQRRI